MTKAQELQIAAELLDVLHRHGVHVDTPYVFENYVQDHLGDRVLSRVLVGDGDKDGDYNEYGKKPIAERIARYSNLPKAKAVEGLKGVARMVRDFVRHKFEVPFSEETMAQVAEDALREAGERA